MRKRAIIQSIHPYFCMLIANGDKIIEIRKTIPRQKPPFKVYIYCTKAPPFLVLGDVFRGDWVTEYTLTRGYSRKEAERNWDVFNGRVLGEYICDTYVIDHTLGNDPMFRAAACITKAEAAAYCTGVTFGWHISDLEIYDTPRELSEFGLKRPPQSWQYVCESEVG